MSAESFIKKRTEFFLKDLHAREAMRLGWYRQLGIGEEQLRMLRARKAQHSAFLLELLRNRDINPAWYARFFYYIGHLFGFCTALLPRKWAKKIENTLEFWILERYKKYFKAMTLDATLRSMVESLQLKKLTHNEPAVDAINLLEKIIVAQEEGVGSR
ncbi:MAG: demethoxyubiquinone hydroxylase family protein [Bacteroidota bacterium]